MRFRYKYPSLIPDSIMQKMRPLLWDALDIATLYYGCKVYCGGKWPLQVEWKRKVRNDFENWEKEFILVYVANLRKDDVVFDIGAEYGEWAALAATIVSGSQVHIFEPNIPAWRRIKKVWNHNRLSNPGGCWAGFVSNQTSLPSLNTSNLNTWPNLGIEDEEVKFENLLEHKDIPSITVDDYVQILDAKPTILMMDIEGAEGLALEGAVNTLRNHKPIVFVSIHPTMLPQFGSEVKDIMSFFSSLNYNSYLISSDHEEHWVFWHPNSRKPIINL